MKILSPIEFRVLALLDSERSGVEVLELYESRTGVEMSRHTLYAALRRMREDRLVRAEESGGRESGFCATARGRRAVEESREFYSELAGFARE